MAKFFGAIGYIKTEETTPGKWTKVVSEKKYSGDFNRISRHWQNGSNVNNDINLQAELSIVADSFLSENMHTIRYVRVNGVPWGVGSIEVQHPRIILSLGGVYNGPVVGDE